MVDKNRQELLVEKEVAGHWKEYFEELLNVGEEMEENIELRDRDQDEDEPVEVEEEITVEEVKQALNLMKNSKASGDDVVPVELMKAGETRIVEWMVRLYNTAYKEEKVTEDW